MKAPRSMSARFRVVHPALLATIVLLCRPGVTGAQTPAPSPRITQEVFVTATVTPVSADLVGRSVTVITRNDLEKLGLRSVIEALRFSPGVDVRARGPRDVQSDLSIRGATFGQNLMLADGMRLNDSQSGHHNGEVPLPAIAVDRVEIVAGAGSAVHGADALGGIVNVIMRRDAFATASLSVGEHGYADAQAALSGHGLPAGWTLAGWSARSSGFTFDRDFAQGGAALRGSPARGLIVDVRHQRRAFGANGFYGPSPSKEWTDQTMAGVTWQRQVEGWTSTTRALVRNHGDHFRWDINRPGFAENRHRTNAVEASLDVRRPIGRGTFTFGGSAGGDWVESSNLGDHDYSRGSLFAELQTPVANRTSVNAGLRLDEYSSFGRSISPSLSAVTTLTSELRARASVAHAFRTPTFTELYYSDPSNLGSPDLVAEQAWTLDAGLDWSHRGWGGSFSVFRRWDEDVIDWVRTLPADRWRSTNVRDVRARGVEVSISRRWTDALVRVSYAALDLDAPSLPLLSKYVLEYATHQAGVSLSVPTVAGVRFALNVDHRTRRDGQSYELVSARLSRSVGRVDLFVDGTNLLGETYREVAGVVMPGRWITAGVTVR